MRIYLTCIVAIALLVISSCDVILDINLKSQKVNVLAPGDSVILSSTGVTFWWDSLPGAAKYNVQIVSPSFTNIQFLITDTMVIGNKFNYSFQPGNYQWRIQARNYSSSSEYVTRSFSVDSSLNLSNEVMQLISPVNNFMTSLFDIDFQWSPVFYATDYRFEILNSSGSLLHVDAAVTENKASYTFLTDGRYTWRVRAQNANSVSTYSQATLLIDNTAPEMPTILSPANNATVTNPFTLNWVQPTDNGSFVYDSLYLYYDTNQDTAIKAVRPAINSYTDSLEARNYYWKLRAIDSLGNRSSYTPLYKFTLH